MKNKIGVFFIVFGALMLFAACGLRLYNQEEQTVAEEAAAERVVQIVEVIKEREAILKEDGEGILLPMAPQKQLTVVEIDGYEYIGYLSIPTLQLELPIMNNWSYPQLKVAPCRYTGDLYSDDLVLMAHNYDRHFGRLSELRSGDFLHFTDMDGNVTYFEVIALEILPPYAIEEMTAGEYDLTLFTCTFGGQNRVTVRCDQVK